MSYFEDRQIELYKASEQDIGIFQSKLDKAFRYAKNDIQNTINSFYLKYANAEGISYAQSQKILDKTELGELKDFIEKSLVSSGKYSEEVLRLSLKSRITRYKALEEQINLILSNLYSKDYEKGAKEVLGNIYDESYKKSLFNISQYKGYQASFSTINADMVRKLLDYPFNGANFSARLWKQKEHLQSSIMESLTTMMIQGSHPNKLATELANKMKVKRFEAYRLLHTESSFLINEATRQAYLSDGIEKYQILGVLDTKTCSVCGSKDNKIYKVSEGVVGVNEPPFHPLCRCTTVPYVDDLELDDEDNTRTARDEKGEYIKVPADMSYEEWKEKVFGKGKDTGRDTKPKKKLKKVKTLDNIPKVKQKEVKKKVKISKKLSSIPKIKAKEILIEESQESIIELPKTLKEHEKYVQEWNKENRQGIVNKETENLIIENMKNILNSGDYAMRFKDEYIENLVKDGRFKNQFETGTSGGTIHKGYRKTATRNLFGIETKGFKAKDYEKYGYLAPKDYEEDFMSSFHGGLHNYGTTIIKFDKEKLRNRITYTIDDSLGPAVNRQIIADKITKPTLGSISTNNIEIINSVIDSRGIFELRDLKENIYGFRYIELQYHGDLTLKDVKEICFTYRVPSEEVIDKLKEYGIKVFRIEGGGITEM